MPPMPHSLLVYTDGEVIGDGILRLAFAAALKQTHPSLHLTWLASGYSVYATSLKEMADGVIDELIILPQRRIPAREYLRGPALLRGRRFDAVIDTQRNFKRSLWLSRIRHDRFISASSGGLFCRHPLPALSPHFLKRLMQLGELALGVPLAAPALAPLPSSVWDAQASALLPAGTRYIGFIVGAGHPDKCWPLEQFITLATEVSTQGCVPVIFLGPNEAALATQIRTALPDALFPLQAREGASSPYLTIALGRRLSAAVANDSGGGHLLAAADTPLVSLFRSASVREKFLPRSTRVIALAPEDFGGTAMRDITCDAVAEALSDLLRVA